VLKVCHLKSLKGLTSNKIKIIYVEWKRFEFAIFPAYILRKIYTLSRILGHADLICAKTSCQHEKAISSSINDITAEGVTFDWNKQLKKRALLL